VPQPEQRPQRLHDDDRRRGIPLSARGHWRYCCCASLCLCVDAPPTQFLSHAGAFRSDVAYAASRRVGRLRKVRSLLRAMHAMVACGAVWTECNSALKR
jgi:hypothetical protein